MTKAQDLAAVITLACLTESRTDAEQRALLRVADELDRGLARRTVTNRNYDAGTDSFQITPRLCEIARATRVLDDGDHEVDHVVMYVGSGPYGSSTVIAAASTSNMNTGRKRNMAQEGGEIAAARA